jgi:hypothetical protein
MLRLPLAAYATMGLLHCSRAPRGAWVVIVAGSAGLLYIGLAEEKEMLSVQFSVFRKLYLDNW